MTLPASRTQSEGTATESTDNSGKDIQDARAKLEAEVKDLEDRISEETAKADSMWDKVRNVEGLQLEKAKKMLETLRQENTDLRNTNQVQNEVNDLYRRLGRAEAKIATEKARQEEAENRFKALQDEEL